MRDDGGGVHCGWVARRGDRRTSPGDGADGRKLDRAERRDGENKRRLATYIWIKTRIKGLLIWGKTHRNRRSWRGSPGAWVCHVVQTQIKHTTPLDWTRTRWGLEFGAHSLLPARVEVRALEGAWTSTQARCSGFPCGEHGPGRLGRPPTDSSRTARTRRSLDHSSGACRIPTAYSLRNRAAPLSMRVRPGAANRSKICLGTVMWFTA